MARFVRTQREVEGRFEDVFALVDEDDDLETWRDEDQLTLVGRPAPRRDGAARASGVARYTVDVQLPRMLHAAVLRSPHAAARVVSLDLDAARAVPGVRVVLGPDDPLGSAGSPVLTAEPTFAGEPIAAVAAETADAARAGLEALAPVFEVLPHESDLDSALADQRFTEEPSEGERGDVDAALAAADVTVELSLETPRHLQTPLEPHAAVARWEGDELTVWISTQGMFDARRELADRFDLPVDRVRVVSEFVGGGFGAKKGAGPEGALAAALSLASGRPVRVVNDRHAEQLVGGRRGATRQTVTIYRRGSRGW